MKYIALIFAISILSCRSSNQISSNDDFDIWKLSNSNIVRIKKNFAPPNLSKDYENITLKKAGMEIIQSWKKDKEKKYFLSMEDIIWGSPKKFSKRNFYNNNQRLSKKLQFIFQKREVYSAIDSSYTGKFELQGFAYGKGTEYYPSGSVSRIYCMASNAPPYTSSLKWNVCGKEISYNEDGSIAKTENHSLKCDMGCGEFTPFLEVDAWYKVEETIDLLDDVNDKTKIIGKLQKGDIVQVLENTEKIEEIGPNVAPWVKIAYGDDYSSTGYVFGSSSFLSGPYE